MEMNNEIKTNERLMRISFITDREKNNKNPIGYTPVVIQCNVEEAFYI